MNTYPLTSYLQRISVCRPKNLGGRLAFVAGVRRFRHTLPRTIREHLQSNSSDAGDVKLCGWVQSIRKMKNISFVTINDGSTAQSLQVVTKPENAKGLTIGCAARISGSWQTSLNEESRHRELVASGIEVLGVSDPSSYPLQKKSHSTEYLRSLPHFRLRSNTAKSLLILKSMSISYLQKFFEEKGFLQTHPPILTSSDCEGAGEAFSVGESGLRPFFRNPVYLTVSTQLHLEALALASSRVWSLSPVFRAEKSDTARHLNEFYMLEAEIAFVDKIAQLMELVEDMIKFLMNRILSNQILTGDLLARRGDKGLRPEELKHRWSSIVSKPWARIPYTDAVTILQKAVSDSKQDFKFPVTWGSNLQSEHEKYLADSVSNGAPVFITHFPLEAKPFYMLATDDQDHAKGRPTVECFDLLLPSVGEIVGGSMREHRYEALRDALKRDCLSEATQNNLAWYLELRKWGSVPHGGFGLGFDRFLAYISGMENIRETATFPRWYDRCQC